MRPPSRNAPCPCGSGRRYKQCCLRRAAPHLHAGAAVPDHGAALWTPAERTRTLNRLAAFALSPAFAEDRRLALLLFWGGRLDLAAPEDARRLESDEHVKSAFLDWFLFDLALERDGDTAAGRFLARHGSRLGAGEAAYLERMRHSCLRPYEVVDVRPDEGLGLVDLWSGERVDVRERLGTRQLVRWDVLAVRVIDGPDGVPELHGVPYLYPPEAKAAVLAELRRRHRQLRRRLAEGDATAFFKRVGMVFHHFWLDYVALRPPPTVVTAEGHPIVLAKAVFDVSDRVAVERVLAGHPDLDRQDDGSYVWLEDAGSRRRSLGTLALGPKRLTIETLSRERADRARQFAEALLGDAVRFRAVRYEDPAAALARRPASRRRERLEVPTEVEAEVVTAFYREHYRGWLDQPIPALNNRTPRSAARLKSQRPRVVALLKELENGMERQAREGRPTIDVGWLWEELGLPRP